MRFNWVYCGDVFKVTQSEKFSNEKHRISFHLPPIMYKTTSMMMPTLLNINAVMWRQCALARSAKGFLGRRFSDRCLSISLLIFRNYFVLNNFFSVKSIFDELN